MLRLQQKWRRSGGGDTAGSGAGLMTFVRGEQRSVARCAAPAEQAPYEPELLSHRWEWKAGESDGRRAEATNEAPDAPPTRWTAPNANLAATGCVWARLLTERALGTTERRTRMRARGATEAMCVY
jgi:hypothetical protein